MKTEFSMRDRTGILFLTSFTLLLCLATTHIAADDKKYSATQIEFFESKVRPLLSKHCYECHGPKAKEPKGGLRLDSRTSAIKGGDSGAAIIPNKPKESLMMEAVRWESYEMPPQQKLPAREIAILEKWITMGAPWPNEKITHSVKSSVRKTYDWPKLRREHWSFRKLTKPISPKVNNESWSNNKIDHFILSRLEKAGLNPSPPATPLVLVRRIYFDLIGLPPSPAETDDFLLACRFDRQAAISKLVNKLLDSPHYGERWGRHWLDVARYSDGYGGFNDRAAMPHAWRYRDWVVNAFNCDLPYDQFVKLQIAGDILDRENKDHVATGFLALGPTYVSDGGDPESVAQAKSETLDDRIDTLSRGLLGLTVSCARCHDHKFDPIPQMDYYSLAGVFNNSGTKIAPAAPPEQVKIFDAHQRKINNIQQQINRQRNQLKKQKRQANENEKKQSAKWQTELNQLKKTLPRKYDQVHSMRETGSVDMKIALRGDLRKPGELAPRRLLRILGGENPPRFDQGSGRLQLAESIASAENPLTARVFVNRVWMHHFGHALVRSPSNFGELGEKPTHPQLLDFLAVNFIESGWSVKELHRQIIFSATYQMSSLIDEKAFQTDGDNRLVWRMNPRRLDAENWRDALLTVTGELDCKTGGQPTDNIHGLRRTLYLKVSRNGDRFTSDEFLRLFDFPIMRATVAKRSTSIVPQQFLFLMNSRFMFDRARAFVSRLDTNAKDDSGRLNLAYRLLYGRIPSEQEKKLGLAFLSQTKLIRNPIANQSSHKATTKSELTAWEQYAQVLLSSNEFMYVR